MSCGSNCTVAVLDDGNVSFWGDFTSGALRLSNDARKSKKFVRSSPLKTQNSNFKLPEPTKEDNIDYGRSSMPKIISLPHRPKSALNDDKSTEYKVYIT